MRLHGVVNHPKHRALGAAATIKPARKHLAHAHIGNKVGRPLLRRRRLLEVAFLAVITIAKNKWVVANKLIVVEGVDDSWRARHRDVARRLHAGRVMMLVPGIHRNREVASLLPLKSFLLLRFDPDRARALAFENVYRFLEKMAVRSEERRVGKECRSRWS